MKEKRKNLIISLLPLVIIPLIFLTVYLYQKFLRYYLFPCPFKLILNIYCPGCGGTRCVLAFMEGDILRAIRCNAIDIAIVVWAFFYWLENLLAIVWKKVKIIPRNRIFIITVSGLAVAYIILRNFIPFLAPI